MVYKGVTSRRKGGLQGDYFKNKGWSTRGKIQGERVVYTGITQGERVVYKEITSRRKGGLQGDKFKDKGWSTRE